MTCLSTLVYTIMLRCVARKNPGTADHTAIENIYIVLIINKNIN